jgi:hypothetical protein
MMKVGILEEGSLASFEEDDNSQRIYSMSKHARIEQMQMKGAYAVTPYCCAMPCWLSTLTLVNVTEFFLECLADNDSNIGLICLHGPHQSA